MTVWRRLVNERQPTLREYHALIDASHPPIGRIRSSLVNERLVFQAVNRHSKLVPVTISSWRSGTGRRKADVRFAPHSPRRYHVGSALPNRDAGRSHCRGVLPMTIGDRSLRAIPKSVASMASDQSVSSAAPRLPAISAIGAPTKSSATRARDVRASNPRPVFRRSVSPRTAAAAIK